MRLLVTLLAGATWMLAACGGGSGPLLSAGGSPVETGGTTVTASSLSAAITPAGPALDPSAAVVVQFDARVDPGSLQLTGTLAPLAGAQGWSTGGNVLTLAPPAGGWPRGLNATLDVQASGANGTAMGSPASARFVVPLQLSTGSAALAAVGQPTLGTANDLPFGAPTAQSLKGVYGSPAITPDGRLFIADYGNSRVLGYPSLPGASGATADLVLGQADFTSVTGGTPTQNRLSQPTQISIGGGRLSVADFGNSRVLLWNSVPSASGALPDVVLGQSGFTSNSGGCGANRLNFPESALLAPGGKLIVADTENHRVLVWNSVPTASGAAPDLVIGQGSLTRCRRNDDNQDNVADPAPSARTLYRPGGVWSDGRRLVVNDRDNNRVLVWNTFPTANFQPADLVLGQGSFTTGAANDDDQNGVLDSNPSARTLRQPYGGVHSNGVQLAIGDSGNNRVLVWNSFPTASFQPADAVLGQSGFGTAAPGTSATTMNMPTGVLFHQDKLLVSDRNNHRLLVLQSP
ncbi:MAG TPA: hypothetical protein VFE82_08510 [Ramlibacter sp.]|jgi:hypothetical protein|uniref:hypothetical protein n=1 Tax=Ramlibacter sp. TaxID=1917967 RepID=UPI002D3B71F0|nr:hypothetical protein [Ramlibacter sp.]HZY18510.1 hypothetical protein [Ramlibacter sp.]